MCTALSMMGCAMLATTAAASQSVAVRVPSDMIRRTAVTVHVDDVSLKHALQQIAHQAGLTPYYSVAVVNNMKRVTLHVQNAPIMQVFEQALRGTGLQATIVSDRVVFETSDGANDGIETGTLNGIVTDAATKAPLRNATIAVAGLARSATTHDDGRFVLTGIPAGQYTVTIRRLGYVRTTRTVTIQDDRTVSLDVALSASVNALDQVIVTGTVVATAQREVPNAMTVITAKDLEARGITQIEQLFRGDIPSLFVLNTGSWSPLDSVTMFSRGTTRIPSNDDVLNGTPGTNTIKTYVDGVELTDPAYMSQIDPRSIERIEILSGPQASTIYGSNAINGVMQIFTKRGTTSRPQVTLNLMSGLVENNFRPSFTPIHTYDLTTSGREGRWSYQAGGSWDYTGRWTPSKQSQRLSGFGGGRMRLGILTTDVNMRRATTRSLSNGDAMEVQVWQIAEGLRRATASNGRTAPRTSALYGQTLGSTLSLTPTSWWSHELVIGLDASNTESMVTGITLRTPSDTTLDFSQSNRSRLSERYATTVQRSLTDRIRATLTLGADHWTTQGMRLTASPMTLTGTLANPTVRRERAGKNTGGFVQTQIGLWNALFFTYGLRAEWNPNYGDEAQPNLAPRYGVAYTFESGSLTTKLRASYGRSTRPPLESQKLSQPLSTSLATTYGPADNYLASPDLGPEFQQGGEGGIEFYLGNRGSLVITRYNQTVDGLIGTPYVDSIRSLQMSTYPAALLPILRGVIFHAVDAENYLWWYQRQYMNVGSIRNQGWELQGSLNVGPLTAKGTYSWTKSRVIGITPKYRSVMSVPDILSAAGLIGNQYQVGRPADFLPEHTWATTITYTNAGTSASLNLTGSGEVFLYESPIDTRFTTVDNRLQTSQYRYGFPPNYRAYGPGYMMSNMDASHRFSKIVEATLHIQNLSDFYRNDRDSRYATIGRQSRMGLRIRW